MEEYWQTVVKNAIRSFDIEFNKESLDQRNEEVSFALLQYVMHFKLMYVYLYCSWHLRLKGGLLKQNTSKNTETIYTAWEITL